MGRWRKKSEDARVRTDPCVTPGVAPAETRSYWCDGISDLITWKHMETWTRYKSKDLRYDTTCGLVHIHSMRLLFQQTEIIAICAQPHLGLYEYTFSFRLQRPSHCLTNCRHRTTIKNHWNQWLPDPNTIELPQSQWLSLLQIQLSFGASKIWAQLAPPQLKVGLRNLKE